MDALARRNLAPLRGRPAGDAHARDVDKANGPRVLKCPRRRTLNEPKPGHEAPLAVAQQVAYLAAGTVRQQDVAVVDPPIEDEVGHWVTV